MNSDIRDLSPRPTAPSQDLSRFPVLRALAQALIAHATRQPGVPMSQAELIEAAWPNQRILPKAARNRLHVSIHKLRRMLFGGALIRTRRGYCLRVTESSPDAFRKVA
jgi:DNA-binding winged helix-turn-helix (wHTH) protein